MYRFEGFSNKFSVSPYSGVSLKILQSIEHLILFATIFIAYG
jgi:hypothetical protein